MKKKTAKATKPVKPATKSIGRPKAPNSVCACNCCDITTAKCRCGCICCS